MTFNEWGQVVEDFGLHDNDCPGYTRSDLDRVFIAVDTRASQLAKAEAEGLKALGRLAVEAGDLEQAGAHFEQAVSAAEADELALNEAKVELGVNNGQVGFEEWMAAHFAEGQGEPTATPRVDTFGC